VKARILNCPFPIELAVPEIRVAAEELVNIKRGESAGASSCGKFTSYVAGGRTTNVSGCGHAPRAKARGAPDRALSDTQTRREGGVMSTAATPAFTPELESNARA
jgi:hypothetical protein